MNKHFKKSCLFSRIINHYTLKAYELKSDNFCCRCCCSNMLITVYIQGPRMRELSHKYFELDTLRKNALTVFREWGLSHSEVKFIDFFFSIYFRKPKTTAHRYRVSRVHAWTLLVDIIVTVRRDGLASIVNWSGRHVKRILVTMVRIISMLEYISMISSKEVGYNYRFIIEPNGFIGDVEIIFFRFVVNVEVTNRKNCWR